MKKAYFQYYETFEVILEKIKDTHQRGELREAIMRHRCEINVQNAAKTPAAGMKKPTAEEIRAYCKDKGYAIDAEHFLNYYEANGWKVGRNAMKSWKAALANWAARDRGKGTMYSAASPDANTAAYNGIL